MSVIRKRKSWKDMQSEYVAILNVELQMCFFLALNFLTSLFECLYLSHNHTFNIADFYDAIAATNFVNLLSILALTRPNTYSDLETINSSPLFWIISSLLLLSDVKISFIFSGHNIFSSICFNSSHAYQFIIRLQRTFPIFKNGI